MRIVAILFFFLISSKFSKAQVWQLDSLPNLLATHSDWNIKQWITSDAPLQKTGIAIKQTPNWNFFIALALVFFFGVYRLLFPKFLNDLLRIARQPSFYTKQIREQVKANVLASIMLNIFFAMVIGVFVHLVLVYNGITLYAHPMLQLLMCIAGVGAVYLVKFLSLQFFSWAFKVNQEGGNYIFIVFFFNKILAILLLPIVCYLLIGKHFLGIVVALSLLAIAVMLLYRYILSYISVAKSLQITKFHFFLYLCTVEIAPLLLLYKALLVNYK